MNWEALRDIADDLVRALDRAREAKNVDTHAYEIARDEVIRLIPGAKAIGSAVRDAPSGDDFEPVDDGWEFRATLDAALRLQGILRLRTRLDEAMGSSGPVLPAERFHPWVWEAAESLWRDGYHRNAIHAACAQIENRLQAKVGREDVSGTALVREAFTLKDPEAGKGRLRFHWLSTDSEAYKSAHEGASALGAGCFLIIRNSAAHRPTQLDENVALEHLVCLSFLARLIDAASVSVAAGDWKQPPSTSAPFG